MIDQSGERLALSDLHRLQAALTLAKGDRIGTESSLRMAIAIPREQGDETWELRAAINLARVWQSLERIVPCAMKVRLLARTGHSLVTRSRRNWRDRVGARREIVTLCRPRDPTAQWPASDGERPFAPDWPLFLVRCYARSKVPRRSVSEIWLSVPLQLACPSPGRRTVKSRLCCQFLPPEMRAGRNNRPSAPRCG